MKMRRLVISASACVLAYVTLVALQAQRQGAVSAAGVGQGTNQQAGAGGGGRRGGGGGNTDAARIGEGTLIAGAWGRDTLPVDSRGWGWMSKSYVGANYKRPF